MHLDDFLSQNAKTKTFEKGALICAQGQEAEAAYCIIEGEVEIFVNAAKSSVLAKLSPGEIFGEMALLRFDRYTLSARAAGPVKAYVIPPELLQAQIQATHPLVKAILDMLIRRVHDANEVLIDLDRINRA